MRFTRLFLITCAAALCGEVAGAQLTLINRSRKGPDFATTTGNAHKIDTAQKVIGRASVFRATGVSNQSYLSTGIALDPNSNGDSGCTSAAANGYTIQFWYRPAQAGTFSYLFGDVTWTGASGAFRCFQNGAAGGGNLYLRGPLGQLRTTTAPLLNNLNPQGWVHLAVVQNNTAGTLTWYVNGAQAATGTSTGTGKGKNFTCMGYNGSASQGATGHYDDFRVYNWARLPADIAADYTKLALGKNMTSGCWNQPDDGYYWGDIAVNPHIGKVALLNEPAGAFTRLFTTGDTIQWSATSPATGPFGAIALINLFTGALGSKTPRQDAYQQPIDVPSPPGPFNTAIVPGLVLGSPFSTPAGPGLFWPQPVAYGNGSTGTTGIQMPPLGFVDGDRFDVQWIVLDSTYPPIGLGNTNHLLFEYVSPKKKYGCHVDVRGINTIQDTGFFEVWNTGSTPIKQVVLDLTGVTSSITWDTGGALNSGGTLAGGDSFRHLTDQICSLTPKTGQRFTIDATNKILTFDFLPASATETGFSGPQNHFIFDCDTNPTGNGRRYVGMNVTVTFQDGKKLGPSALIADPADTMGAQVDRESN